MFSLVTLQEMCRAQQEKKAPNMTHSPTRISGILSNFVRRLWLSGLWRHTFCLAKGWSIVSDAAGSKRRNAKRPVGRKRRGVVQKQCFEVKMKPLHYTTAPGNYTSDPRLRQICHTSVYENAIIFWTTFLLNTDMLERSSYQTASFILHGPTK